MEIIASLIREFPLGSFLIITGMVAGIVTVAKAYVNRNRPIVDCNCECCTEDEDEEDEEEDED